jgi:hypothetical protein
LTLGVIQFIFHECRNCSDPKSCLKDSQVDCDESFLARQDSGWLSVSGLGAVSAESYGRDSFVENLLVLASCGLVCLLRLTTIKPIEIEGGLQESLKG